jgi:predicted Zn-dependent protease
VVPQRYEVRAVIARDEGYVHIAGALLLLVALCAFAAFLYCSAESQTVPVTGRHQKVAMSEKDQAKLGADAYAQVLQQESSNIVSSGPEADMVQDVGKRIAAVADDPGFDWQFTLIQSTEVNAWCLPGGKVAVYSGILAVTQDEAGLAVVMAHEIGHAVAQHGAERMLQEQLTQVGLTAVSSTLGGLSPQSQGALLALFGAGAQFGVLLPFSRDMESEADHIGLIYMARAGVDPANAVALWQRMEARDKGSQVPEYVSDHPSDATRIKNLEKWMPEAEKVYQQTLEKQ